MNKRLERALRILILLQSGSRYDALKLSHELNVTRRTIFRDIAMLKEFGLTIEYDINQQTYCVQVLNEHGIAAGHRRLGPQELGRALQQSLAGEDPAMVSSAMVIRQVATNLASMTGQTGDHGSNAMIEHLHDSGVDSTYETHSTLATQPGTDAGEHCFKNRSKQIDFLVRAIDSQRTLTIWDRTKETNHNVVAAEIRYAANNWSLVAITPAGDVLTLQIDQLDFGFEHKPTE